MRRPNAPRMAGFSYMEVLAASLLIGVAMIPALQALQSGAQGSSLQQQELIDRYLLAARMEELLAQPYSDLASAALAAGGPAVATGYSDSLATSDGRLLVREVFLAAYDGDNLDGDNNPFTGGDDGLLWVRVSVPGSVLRFESLVRQ